MKEASGKVFMQTGAGKSGYLLSILEQNPEVFLKRMMKEEGTANLIILNADDVSKNDNERN